MSPALHTTPPATQARMLREVADAKYPKIAVPSIASHFHVTLTDLQAILNRHGYPDVTSMRHHADQLEAADHSTGDTPDDDAGDPAGVYTAVKVTDLHPDPDNPREELRDIEDLADSIKEAGLLQPIVARRVGKQLIVVAGHRRLAAVQHLRWTEVQCIVRADIRPADVLAAMLIENGQRSDLDPIEEAHGLRRLKAQLACSDHDLGRKIGRSQPVVSARLALLGLTAEEQQQVRAGGMTLGEATYKGRLNAGKVRPTGLDMNWHLGPNHNLAQRAKARCQRLEHLRGRRVGGMACGACWESVIRADERDHLQQISTHLGNCATCDAPIHQETTA